MKKIALLLSLAFALVSCGGTENSSLPSSSSSGEKVCDTTVYADEVKLTLDYKGRVFTQDGIGEVKMIRHVDGDTTHVHQYLADGTEDTSEMIALRYNCIDTPESTGGVEPWGYDASDYTHRTLENAAHIVVSSNFDTYHLPEKDGNLRYLAYVWVTEVEDPKLEDFRLLNIELVEQDLAQLSGVEDSMYVDEFYKADEKARCSGNYIHSDREDPRLPKSAISTTIMEIVEGKKWDSETETYIDWDWMVPSNNPGYETSGLSSFRVTFPCTVAYSISDQGDNAYVADYAPTPDDPSVSRWYGIYVFGFYKTVEPLRRVGWRLQMNGILTQFNGNYQIADVHYSNLYPGDDYISVISKDPEADGYPVYEIPTVTLSELQDDYYVNLPVRIENVHGITGTYGTYSDDDGDAYTLMVGDDTSSDRTYLRVYSGTLHDRHTSSPITAENFEDYFSKPGETFNVVGPLVSYTNSKGTTQYQIQVLKDSDLTFND